MLTLAYIRGMELRCSIPVLLLLPLAAVFGELELALVLLFSLALHELAHTVMAERLGYRAAVMEIQPFGFIARLSTPVAAAGDALAIALAGPAASLFAAVCAGGMLYFSGNENPLLLKFAAFDLSLGIMNLIPVLPLDGGRLLEAIIERKRGKTRAVRALATLGIGFGALCAVAGSVSLFMGSINPSPLFTGLFIALAALNERKRAAMNDVKNRLSRNADLRRGRALNVRMTAISADATVRDALRSTASGGYNMFILLDKACGSIGMLDESRLLEAAYSGFSDISLYEVLYRGSSVQRPVRPQGQSPCELPNAVVRGTTPAKHF